MLLSNIAEYSHTSLRAVLMANYVVYSILLKVIVHASPHAGRVCNPSSSSSCTGLSTSVLALLLSSGPAETKSAGFEIGRIDMERK